MSRDLNAGAVMERSLSLKAYFVLGLFHGLRKHSSAFRLIFLSVTGIKIFSELSHTGIGRID